MDEAKKTQPAGAKMATVAGKGSPSKSFLLGRRLSLRFVIEDQPELQRIEFRYDGSKNSTWCERKLTPYFGWKSSSQALSIFLLEYLVYASQNSPSDFRFSGAKNGSYVASIGNARAKGGFIEALFVEPPGSTPCWGRLFSDLNLGGSEDRERVLWVNTDFLPPDCVEIFWEGHGDGKPIRTKEVKTLLERVRKSLEPGSKSETKEDEDSPKTEPPSVDQVESSQSQSTRKAPAEFEEAPDEPPRLPESEPDEPIEDQEENPRTSSAREDRPFSSFKSGRSSKAEEPPAPTIDESLLTIHNPCGYSWENSHPLLDLGEDDGSKDDIWQLKDACEGVLILGAPSSGKTSSSAFAIAASFLRAGFGGLVLTAKTDEARRWKLLCSHFGREEDCIVVAPNGPHKLNVLAYETQRGKGRIGLTDDLISFFRVLIAIVSKRPSHHGNDDFWVNSTNQLMRNLFDVFLLAKEPMSIDSLMRFINHAPKKPTDDWECIPYFGSILQKAKKGVRGNEDMRIFTICLEYWTVAFPNIADATRSGITTGFSSMAATLSGRGIHDLISTDTTLTPESSILSGKIVILDLSLKECGQGGLLVQAAWKYLLQRAIERRVDKGLKTAIPVFLWADEGHLFFSQHDIDFQPTARDCRCAHVIISQNLHNFYQLGHSTHAVQGVFATMNSHVFHANGDLETNKWAAERLGTAVKTRVNVSISSQPKQEQKHWFWDAFKPDARQSSSSASTTQQRENIVQPEDFSKLKKGGDGTAEAIVLWVSHRFKANKDLPFCRKLFAQDDINHQ